jgi:hypothetical protein
MTAKKTETIQGKLKMIKFIENSRDGNPKYLITIGEYVLETTANSSLGYTISNFDGMEVEAEIKIHRKKLCVIECKQIN